MSCKPAEWVTWPFQNWHEPRTQSACQAGRPVLSWQVCLSLHPRRSRSYSPQLQSKSKLIQEFTGQDWRGSEVPKPRAHFRGIRSRFIRKVPHTPTPSLKLLRPHSSPSAATARRRRLLSMMNTCPWLVWAHEGLQGLCVFKILIITHVCFQHEKELWQKLN